MTGPQRRVESRHFEHLDSIRAVALLLIMLFHGTDAGMRLGGLAGSLLARLDGVATALFFALSGFLLYRPFLAARWNGERRPSIARFLRHRALRILPAYWFALLVLGLTVGVSDLFTERWWTYATLTSVFTAWTSPLQGLAIAWPLTVEVSFCLLLALWAPLRARVRPRVLTEIVPLVIAVLIGAATQLTFLASGGTLGHLDISLPNDLGLFAIGMAVALWSVRTEAVGSGPLTRLVARRPALTCWLPAAAAYALLCRGIGVPPLGSSIQSFSPAVWVAMQLLPGVVAALILLPAVIGEGDGGLVRLTLSSPVLRWIGALSYALYLWHPTIQGLLRYHGVFSGPGYADAVLFLVTSVALTLPLAVASRLLVERPMLGLRDLALPRRVPAAGAAG